MPEAEPNKKMDGLLRAYAKKPRPAVELHPVSRRVLQEEVKTIYGPGEAQRKKKGFWPAWWIRWPVAAGLAAWAVALVLSNRRYEEGQTLSRRAESAMAARKSENLRREPEIAATPASPAPQLAPAPSAGPMSLAAPAPAGTAALAAKAFGGARFSNQQVFQNSAPAQQVLDHFQVAREGERVLVRDGDGSVYAGNVVSKAQGGEKAKEALDDLGAGPGYSFSVQGMNRSVQQVVSFNGELVSNDVRGANYNQARAGREARAMNAVAGAQVSGTVTVGATNQYKVEASAPGAP